MTDSDWFLAAYVVQLAVAGALALTNRRPQHGPAQLTQAWYAMVLVGLLPLFSFTLLAQAICFARYRVLLARARRAARVQAALPTTFLTGSAPTRTAATKPAGPTHNPFL